MPVSDGRTERPRGALLRLDIGKGVLIVENRWDSDILSEASGIPPFRTSDPNRRSLETRTGTVSGCQFGWGSRLLKGNAGAQRSACSERKPESKGKAKSRLDCETDESSSPNLN